MVARINSPPTIATAIIAIGAPLAPSLDDVAVNSAGVGAAEQWAGQCAGHTDANALLQSTPTHAAGSTAPRQSKLAVGAAVDVPAVDDAVESRGVGAWSGARVGTIVGAADGGCVVGTGDGAVVGTGVTGGAIEVGFEVGFRESDEAGATVIAAVGTSVGAADSDVGDDVDAVGAAFNAGDGLPVPVVDGTAVGAADVGDRTGDAVGGVVGAAVGAAVCVLAVGCSDGGSIGVDVGVAGPTPHTVKPAFSML